MKRILQLLCLCSASLMAADAPPTVDAVLAKYTAAIGGQDAWSKIEARSIKADVEIFGSSTEWSLRAKSPNKRRTEIELGPLGLLIDGFDGSTAWAKNQSGIKIKEGDELINARNEADFRREIRLKELYPGLAVKPNEKLADEEVYVLEAKPTPTSKQRFSFSIKSGLLLREQTESKNAEGVEGVVEKTYTDYRDVDGLKYPHVHKLKISAGGQEILNSEFKVKAIKHNNKYDDALFVVPNESAAAAADITGDWIIAVDVGGQTGEPQFSFKQDGEKIAGKYSGLLGEHDITGKVSGGKIEFGFTTDQGKIAYTGTIDKDGMKGTTKYGETLEGTWTAKRKAAKSP